MLLLLRISSVLSNMKLPVLASLFVLCTISLSCAPANGPIPDQQVIMPLALGNEWIGQINQYDSKGNLDSSWFDTLSVLRSKEAGGETWYYVHVYWGYGRDTNHLWFTNRSDGLYTCDSEHFTTAYRLAKYPARPHDVCVVFENTSDSTGLYSEYRGIGVDTTNIPVSTPAGQFQCYSYSGFDFSQAGDVGSSIWEPSSFYSPGVGLIQWGYFGLDGKHASIPDTDRTWQLVRAILH